MPTVVSYWDLTLHWKLSHGFAYSLSLSNAKVDVGVPLDQSTSKNDNVIILYNDKHSLPDDAELKRKITSNGEIPLLDTEKSTQNCDVLNLVLMQQRTKRQCKIFIISATIFEWHGRLSEKVPILP